MRRMADAPFVDLKAPESALRERFAQLLNENFAKEALLEEDARTQAEQLVRKGAPGVRREDLDLRRVEQLVKRRLAKERGFVL